MGHLLFEETGPEISEQSSTADEIMA